MTRPAIAAAVTAVLTAAACVTATPADAGAKDTWTLYAGMKACKADQTHRNSFCAGLQDGRALGLVDTQLAADAQDKANHTAFDDENPMPSIGETPVPIVEVWNNSSIIATISPESLRQDAMHVEKIWAVMPGTDAMAPGFAPPAAKALPRDSIPPNPFAIIPAASASNSLPNWNWTASARSQYTSQNQNGLVNLATGGNLCIGLLGVLAPTNNCPST